MQNGFLALTEQAAFAGHVFTLHGSIHAPPLHVSLCLHCKSSLHEKIEPQPFKGTPVVPGGQRQEAECLIGLQTAERGQGLLEDRQGLMHRPLTHSSLSLQFLEFLHPTVGVIHNVIFNS